MKRFMHLSTTLLVAAAFTSAASAATLWDGFDRPSTTSTGNGYTEGGTGFGAVFDADTPSAGFMTQKSSGAGASSLFALNTPGTELNRAAGWTIEMNLEITNTTGDFGMYAVVEDDAGGIYVLFEPGQIEVWRGDFGAMNFAAPITAGFHSYFFSMDPGGTAIDLYIDGSFANSATTTHVINGAATFSFGDGTSGAAADGVWDYVYVNGPPLPEPASLALLALGGVMMLRRRK